MISREDFMNIKAQHARGVYKSDIARNLNVSRKTVQRALKRGSAPPGKRPKRRGSKLDPYKPFVDSQIEDGVLNAVVILHQIKKMGYQGGETILRDYMRPKRPPRKSRATVRFETAPGAQMQSDWGEISARIAGESLKAHFCVNTLGYSRKSHFSIFPSEDAEHTIEAQQRAFRHFGGASRETLVDNQKACVIEHEMEKGKTKKVRFNDSWVDFLSLYGSIPRACKPARPETKGKVENHVGYVKGNFFLMYPEAESFDHYNQLAETWLSEVADPRVHGTTGRVVAEAFSEEREFLLPLPPVPFDTSYVEERIVAWDAYVEVRGNRYAVPDELCGTKVVVKIALDGTLKVFSGDNLVATHTMRPLSEGWVTVPAFHRNLWEGVLSVEKRPLSAYEEVTG